jgi:hypothetical protein
LNNLRIKLGAANINPTACGVPLVATAIDEVLKMLAPLEWFGFREMPLNGVAAGNGCFHVP